MMDTLFAQIVRRELPADLVYQDELVTAFRDVQPQAPTHILVVPNKPVPTVADVTAEDEAALGLPYDPGSCQASGGRGDRPGGIQAHPELPGPRRPGSLSRPSAPAGWLSPREDVVGAFSVTRGFRIALPV